MSIENTKMMRNWIHFFNRCSYKAQQCNNTDGSFLLSTRSKPDVVQPISCTDACSAVVLKQRVCPSCWVAEKDAA